eukprot:10652375-Lingulodinium_polyedra.AAC.1
MQRPPPHRSGSPLRQTPRALSSLSVLERLERVDINRVHTNGLAHILFDCVKLWNQLKEHVFET